MRLPNPYRPEDHVVAHSLTALAGALDWAGAVKVASPWVEAARQHPPAFWALESMLKEYPISSAEGLALMRLAEALMRVPDLDTAIALTADQLGRADFHSAGSASLARISSTAIAMSKHFLPDHPTGAAGSNLFTRLGAQAVVAASLRAVQLLGHQFVLGENIAEALQRAAHARSSNRLCFSYDMLGEGARTADAAERYLHHYAQAIAAIAAHADAGKGCTGNDGISIKLSALHPRYEDAQWPRLQTELIPRVWSLCEKAAQAHINLTMDAEESDRLELSLKVLEALMLKVAQHYPQWTGLGLALQAYQTRALDLVEHVIVLARRHGVRLMCRLVKGAYWDTEIKRAQELGLPHYPVFTHKHHTDISYLACARVLLAAPDVIYPQFATHNAATIAAILQISGRTGAAFELQRLHGMGEAVYREVLKNPLIACRIYAPVGAHKELLAYLVRRLLENGANSSFVHQLADESIHTTDLLASPLHLAPEASLPLPCALYATLRKNSEGVDLTVEPMRTPLLAAYASAQIGAVSVLDTHHTAQLMQASATAFEAWRATPVAARAAMLRNAADALQSRLPYFCALLVKEAFKTWSDAVAEVREAIDFLRYYAHEAERVMVPLCLRGPTGETNTLHLQPRGTWVCISPWNFPLAIFIGQVAAALATGNTVVAKPAEQTPFVALEAVRLLHAAGVPADVLHIVHGAGKTIGAALVAAEGVAGVAFTGSTQVARCINRALATKDGAIVPLIAETGGINAMVVDSSALPEQVCDAVLQSAFRSAGQRCSALRLLCVHEQIADVVLAMIQGAASELAAGDPALLSTDLGPVIDASAYNTIQMHLQRLHTQARPLLYSTAPVTQSGHLLPHLIAPVAFEISAIADMKAEIFGPVLHIVRWRGDPQELIKSINALGYGLTLGIHSRIDSRALQMATSAQVGNVYINRNQIGAVVGVQPFGGQGLSGTGPKAGGPHYLQRFCTEQTITTNTTAAGGNAALLSG